jgi:GT2 family glycosyltransferase
MRRNMFKIKPLATIVIPCFNTVQYTKICIASLFVRTDAPFELVLINNGSTDGTKKYFDYVKRNLKSKFLVKLTVINFNKNIGVPRALNLGVNLSTAPYFIYVNNDVMLTEGWLSKLLYAASRAAHDVGIIGTLFNKVNSKPLSEADINKAAHAVEIAKFRKTASAKTVHGLCMTVKKEVFKNIGLFDEKFFPCFGEDIEFCERAKKAGYKIILAEDVFVYHFWNKATRTKEFKNLYGDIKTLMRKTYKLHNIDKRHRT